MNEEARAYSWDLLYNLKRTESILHLGIQMKLSTWKWTYYLDTGSLNWFHIPCRRDPFLHWVKRAYLLCVWSQKRAGSECRIFYHIILTSIRLRLLQVLSHVFCISIFCAPNSPSFVQLNYTLDLTSIMLRDLGRSMVVLTSPLCLTRARWKCFSRLRTYVLFFLVEKLRLARGNNVTQLYYNPSSKKKRGYWIWCRRNVLANIGGCFRLYTWIKLCHMLTMLYHSILSDAKLTEQHSLGESWPSTNI